MGLSFVERLMEWENVYFPTPEELAYLPRIKEGQYWECPICGGAHKTYPARTHDGALVPNALVVNCRGAQELLVGLHGRRVA